MTVVTLKMMRMMGAGAWNMAILLMVSEIPNNHLGCDRNPVNNGIKYQPQLVWNRRISNEPYNRIGLLEKSPKWWPCIRKGDTDFWDKPGKYLGVYWFWWELNVFFYPSKQQVLWGFFELVVLVFGPKGVNFENFARKYTSCLMITYVPFFVRQRDRLNIQFLTETSIPPKQTIFAREKHISWKRMFPHKWYFSGFWKNNSPKRLFAWNEHILRKFHFCLQIIFTRK